MILQARLDFVKLTFQESTTEDLFEANTTRSTELLELVHSDVCARMRKKSLRRSRVPSYTKPTIHKDEVFVCFQEWKALVKKSSGRKLQTLHTENRGEYTSNKFESGRNMSLVHRAKDT